MAVAAKHATLRRGENLVGICDDSTCKQARSDSLACARDGLRSRRQPTRIIVARIARAESCRIADVRGLIGTAHLDPRALAPSPQASIARAACEHRWPLAGKEGRVQFGFRTAFWECGSIDISPDALEQPE
jgi:hypothetical protein